MTTSSNPVRRPETASGPLVVSTANPRYFTVASDQRKAVYLTGSHIWNNLHDGMGPGAACADTAEHFDYGAYLDFLAEHGHNFIRLWRWEQFKSQAAGGDFHLCMTPQPWARTGPGEAKDGKPKFDLDRFDEAFFDRLRDRVVTADERGIYVAVMFFDGFGLHLSPAPDHVEGHPFHPANNVNQVGIGSIVDYQVLPLDPRVQALQEAYIRKVVDTLHDLPKLLWEVANESSGGGEADPAFAEMLGQAGTPQWGDSTAWQYWVIDRVRQHEAEMGYDRHPMGMTMQFPVPEAGGPARRRRPQGRGHRHRPLRTRPRRRAVGLEVLPARPPSDPDGFRAGRRRQPARRVRRRAHVVCRLRARPLGDGRHAALRRTGGPDPDGAAGRPGLDRVRPGQPRPGVPGPAAEGGGRSVHGDAGAGHLHGGVVRHRGPPDRPWSSDHRPPPDGHQLQPAAGGVRPHRPVPEEGHRSRTRMNRAGAIGGWSACGCRFGASTLQDGPHGAGPDPALVAKEAQLAVDAAVPQVGSPWPAAAPMCRPFP